MTTVAPPSKFSQNVLRVWEGFSDRYRNLAQVCKDHYILMPVVAGIVITTAVLSAPVGWTLTFAALGLISWKGYQASSEYYLGNRQKGLQEFGEMAADLTLLGGGLAVGRAGQAITHVRNGSNAGIALHLVDEVASGILVVKKALQN